MLLLMPPRGVSHESERPPVGELGLGSLSFACSPTRMKWRISNVRNSADVSLLSLTRSSDFTDLSYLNGSREKYHLLYGVCLLMRNLVIVEQAGGALLVYSEPKYISTFGVHSLDSVFLLRRSQKSLMWIGPCQATVNTAS